MDKQLKEQVMLTIITNLQAMGLSPSEAVTILEDTKEHLMSTFRAMYEEEMKETFMECAREMAAEGHGENIDTPEYERATNWMDEVKPQE